MKWHFQLCLHLIHKLPSVGSNGITCIYLKANCFCSKNLVCQLLMVLVTNKLLCSWFTAASIILCVHPKWSAAWIHGSMDTETFTDCIKQLPLPDNYSMRMLRMCCHGITVHSCDNLYQKIMSYVGFSLH